MQYIISRGLWVAAMFGRVGPGCSVEAHRDGKAWSVQVRHPASGQVICQSGFKSRRAALAAGRWFSLAYEI